MRKFLQVLTDNFLEHYPWNFRNSLLGCRTVETEPESTNRKRHTQLQKDQEVYGSLKPNNRPEKLVLQYFET